MRACSALHEISRSNIQLPKCGSKAACWQVPMQPLSTQELTPREGMRRTWDSGGHALFFFFAVVLLGGSTRRKGAKTRVDIAVPSVGCVRRAILSDAIHSQRQDSSQKRRVRRARSPAVCCTTQAGIPPGSNPIAKGCLLREVSLSQPRADNIDAGPCSSSACLSRTGYGAIGAHGDGVCTW